MPKPHITRTYGPIHFEDLDPKRFEDLVRALIIDFREWQVIESTGISGGDDGFDVRAYEKTYDVQENIAPEEDEDIEVVHPMSGNLWMIQCKRQKTITPKQIEEILKDIDTVAPPYGYILAAPAIFSKNSYDKFREILTAKGVQEFAIWGKPELESLLLLPKNDRILFTFFGISISTKRRSLTTQTRARVNNKNKFFRTIGTSGSETNQHILIRDLKDEQYPFKKEVPDFDKLPLWNEYIVQFYIPNGIALMTRTYFAYVDPQKKEYDFTEFIDLMPRRNYYAQLESAEQQKKRRLVEEVWDFLPKENQAYLEQKAYLPFSDIALIDDKGDDLYQMPHVYVDYDPKYGPFAGFSRSLETTEQQTYEIDDTWKRISVFPPTFSSKKLGKVYDTPLELNEPLQVYVNSERDLEALLSDDNSYDHLNIRDVIKIQTDSEYDPIMSLQVTNKYKSTLKEYQEKNLGSLKWNRLIDVQLKSVDPQSPIQIIELKKIYEWQIKEKTQKPASK